MTTENAIAHAPAELEAVERLLRSHAEFAENMLELARNLLASHQELLDIINGMAQQLDAHSTALDNLRTEPSDAAITARAAAVDDDTTRTLREATALTERAAGLFDRAGIEDHRSSATPLRRAQA